MARESLEEWLVHALMVCKTVNFSSRRNGFTLVEIMVVVAILGLLLAITIPAVLRARETAMNSRYASDMRVVTTAFIQYSFDNRTYPADSTPGVIPNGMSEYLKRVPWTKTDALGGQWDWDYQQFGVKAGVSSYHPNASIAQLQRYDAMVDDGDLSTGNFHERDQGYITVIEP
jgi:type IV pilus assembly protein PilA